MKWCVFGVERGMRLAGCETQNYQKAKWVRVKEK